MNNFLTVEDINSILINAFDKSSIHECNTANIEGDVEYTNTTYDFLKVSHSLDSSNHIFSFKINNIAWTGDYYFLDANGDYIDADATYQNDTLILTTSSENVTLGLYISYLKKSYYGFNINRLDFIPLDSDAMVVNEIDGNEYRFKSLIGDDSLNIDTNCLRANVDYGDGIYTYTCYNGFQGGYPKLLLFGLDINEPTFIYNVLDDKADVGFAIDAIEKGTGVIPAKLNIIQFRADKEITTPIKFIYNGQELEYYDKGRTYSVYLDLTTVRSLEPVTIRVIVEESEDYLRTDKNYVFTCRRRDVWDFNRLKTETFSDTPFINITRDIVFSEDIIINRSINIEGNGKTFNLNGHSIILKEDAELTIQNLQVNNGNKALIQNKNSKLIVTNVKFQNNTTTNVGSCIYCNVNMENVNENDDYTTVVEKCEFTNNNSCISHNGLLSVTNTKYTNNDITYANNKFPAFLYQNNGEAGIRNSIFDIDYDTDEFCTNQKSIGFAQALVHCGETAIINNSDMFQLKEDNKLKFFEAPYNNRSHLFCKYYYPRVETCAYSSPKIGFEEKSVCYSISEDNWVYKQNVQVTRADANDENTIRRINNV